MKERPILFSAPMVLAILAGTKTQTRRVVKLPDWFRSEYPRFRAHEIKSELGCPYGQPGDRLWVRETWFADPPNDGQWAYVQWAGCHHSPLSDIPEHYQAPEHCIFRATWDGMDDALRWRPSIHMPRWASRLSLEVIGVRVERLQDISESDAVAEGIESEQEKLKRGAISMFDQWNPVDGFEVLWESINGDGSWDANPWVWAVEFKRLDQVQLMEAVR